MALCPTWPRLRTWFSTWTAWWARTLKTAWSTCRLWCKSLPAEPHPLLRFAKPFVSLYLPYSSGAPHAPTTLRDPAGQGLLPDLYQQDDCRCTHHLRGAGVLLLPKPCRSRCAGGQGRGCGRHHPPPCAGPGLHVLAQL